MRLCKHASALCAATFLAMFGAVAQTNVTPTATEPARDGKVIVPEAPATSDSDNIAAAGLRPARPERAVLPPEVQARVDRFKLDARAYIEKQELLKKQLQGANEKDRAALREQLKELREQWVERAKELRKDYQERQKELSDKLSEYRELLDSIRSSARKQALEAQQEVKTRRGDP